MNVIRFFTVKKKCRHINKKETYRDYQDAYIEYNCNDCGQKIFEDMHLRRRRNKGLKIKKEITELDKSLKNNMLKSGKHSFTVN